MLPFGVGSPPRKTFNNSKRELLYLLWGGIASVQARRSPRLHPRKSRGSPPEIAGVTAQLAQASTGRHGEPSQVDDQYLLANLL